METLTNSGSPGSWQPDYSVESVMNVSAVPAKCKPWQCLRLGEGCQQGPLCPVFVDSLLGLV